MKIKIFTFLLLLSCIFGFSQNVGDFRTNPAATPWSKDWTDHSAWQIWNGSAWDNLTTGNYPGKNPPNTDTNATVTISAGTTISNASAPASLNFKELIVKGTLQLYKDLTLSTPNLIIDGGTVYWMSNNVSLYLPDNAALFVFGYNGSNGIQSDGACTNNRDLYIGGVKYSACNGSGNTVAGDFSYVNTNGGTLRSEPVATPNNYCAVNLPISVALKNADGLNAGISGLEYQWSFVSGPTTITVPSTWSTTSNITLNNLNAIGDYVFKLTVRKKNAPEETYHSGNVTVKIYQPVTSGTVNNINICSKYNTGNVLTLSGSYGAIVKWQSSADNTFTTAVTDIANTTNQLILPNNLNTDRYYRAVLSNGSCSGYSAIATVKTNTTVYTGTWSNGTPDISKKAVFSNNYLIDLDLNACAVEVNNNAVVTIPANKTLTVDAEIEVLSGNIKVENDANLVQVRKDVTNMGNITVRRNAQLKRLDYNYWGSPVSGQNFITFSPQTVVSRFYTYNEIDDTFSSVPNLYSNFVPAKGYAIRAPNNFTTTVQTFVGEFKGVPNNGDITIPVAFTDATRGKNMISNPYPSNIDLRLLHQNNPGLSGGVFYFWTNDANSSTGIDGNTSNGIYGNYTANQYAVLNVLGATPASTPADLSPKYPSAIVKPGQGFIMKVSASGNLKFDNTMRTSATTDGSHIAVFFNRGAGKNSAVNDISGRYWLSLISPAGAKNVMLIGYVKGLVNKIDTQYDAEILSNSSDNIYSILEDRNLAIQGRNAYGIQTDVVPVGVVHYMPGTYKIQLENKDGVFNSSQDIFLRDKEINVIRNISKTPYTYDVSAAGVNNTRFEIVYQNTESVLNATNINKDVLDVVWYKSNENYVLKSNFPIDKVEVFDASGKLIWMKKEIKLKEIVIDYNNLNFGANFIKVTRDNSVKTIKVLK